jgi:Ni/Fe-hydrogenase subunit HybB-like protein
MLKRESTMVRERLSSLRLGFWSAFSGVLILALAGIAYIRYTQGLGAVTHLSDTFPWGLWIGFDLLCGVGLAAGGFAVTATVHILHLKDFKPIVRPTVLTAFLGYLLVITALLLDLGRPWNIWHPIIMWNPHSVMFEVGWCVMLYTTVLSLEFAPVVIERLRVRYKLGWMLKILKTVTPVLVILGVILSTLHQSSLGSLFLIIPEKMHALWYTPMLPVLFFVSALAAGIAMTVVESWFSRRAFGKPIETQLLSRLSRASVLVLALYFVLRLRDLAARDALSTVWPLTSISLIFLAELGFGVVLPMILLAFERFRQSPRRLAAAQGLVVLGFIFHRMNVAITSVEAATGRSYLPSIPEFLISAGLVAVGMTIFVLACRYLPVFPEGPVAETEKAKQPAIAEVPASLRTPKTAGAFDPL